MQLLPYIQDGLGEVFVAIHDVVSAVTLDHVVVSSYNDNIQWPGVLHKLVIQPKSMVKSFNTSLRNSNVVDVHSVTLILTLGQVVWGGKELVESGIRDYHFGSLFRIGCMAALAGGAHIGLVGVLHALQLPQPEAAEVPVVQGYWLCWVRLRIGADLTRVALAELAMLLNRDMLLGSQVVRAKSGAAKSGAARSGAARSGNGRPGTGRSGTGRSVVRRSVGKRASLVAVHGNLDRQV